MFEEKDCLKDEVTLCLCHLFDTCESFCGDDCRAILIALATLVEVDIGAIERQRAISRKVIQSRNTTHAVTLQTLSADFMVRQSMQRSTDSFSFQHFDCTSIVRKLKRRHLRNSKQTKKKIKKRKGGGGAYRAFLSVRTKGTAATAESWSQAKVAYRNLSEEDKAYFKDLGRLATAAHRQGFKAFGPAKKQSSSGAGQLASSLSQSSAVMPVFAAGSQLVIHDPDSILQKEMKQISSTSSQISERTNKKRQEALETLEAFSKNQTPIKAASKTDLLPAAPCVGEDPGNAFIPKPGKIPWLEFVPPADLFAQACSLQQFQFTV